MEFNYSRTADANQKGKPKTPKKVDKVNMDTNLKKKLNTFFSNFSEVHFKSFARDKIDNKELIRFGVWHNYINRSDRFEGVGDEVRLKAVYVEMAVEKYFGRKLKKHESVPSVEYECGGRSLPIRYKNGYYYMTGAEGEGLPFSQIVELFDIGNNEFKAIVDIYEPSNVWEGDPHGTPEQWQREDPYDVPEPIGQMTAIIKKVYSDKKERYILLEYLPLEIEPFTTSWPPGLSIPEQKLESAESTPPFIEPDFKKPNFKLIYVKNPGLDSNGVYVKKN